MRRAACGRAAWLSKHATAARHVSSRTPSLTLECSSGRRCLSQGSKRSIAQFLEWNPAEKVDDVVVEGYVRSVRSMKSHRFVSLGDGSSLAPLQALIDADQSSGCEQPSPTCVSR